MRLRALALLMALFAFGAAPLVPLAQEEEASPGAAENGPVAVDERAPGERDAAEDAAAEDAAGVQDDDDDRATSEDAAAVQEDAAVADDAAVEEDDWEMPELPDDFLGDDIFIPTEEISADEEVVFPVNI